MTRHEPQTITTDYFHLRHSVIYKLRREKYMSNFCFNCNKDVTASGEDTYDLQVIIWLQAVRHTVTRMNDFLCIVCVEQALRRPLTARDFSSATVNVLQTNPKILEIMGREQ